MQTTTPLEITLMLYLNDNSILVDDIMYRQLVGTLIYLTTNRPYISFVVNMVSIFMLDPWDIHYKVAKRIMMYMHGIFGYGLVYISIVDFRLIDYIDLDWVG
jgi:hypothetical protein